MGYDDVIPLLGDFGRYQKRIYLLLCLPAIICAFHKLANVFLQAKPDYRCQLPGEFSNSSYFLPPEILNVSYPYDEITKQYSNCFLLIDGEKTSCSEYIYDHTKYKTSAVMEWNMVCDRAYMRATSDALFMLGVMLGSIVFGELSDRYGRKIIFFISLVIQVIFGLIAAVAPEFWTYTLTRLIVGATTSGVFLVAYVIAMEMVGPSKRLIAGVVCQMFFSMGYMLTALFAYYISEWRQLQIALTIPGLLFFSYWWLIPESTRWLLTNNRVTEAKYLIHKIAKVNHVTIVEEQLDQLLIDDNAKAADPNEKRARIYDVFKYPNLRKKSLIIFFDWFANSMTYYGLSWNTSNLGGNDYLNFVASGAVEIPAYTFLLLTLNRWGRKSILCGSMVWAGVSLLLTMVVPQDMDWLVVTLAMIGKLAITASYGTIYIFSVEQFPTVIRNAGLGASSTAARMGSILAPLINILSDVWKPFPLIIFGILALSGGCLSLLLPETLNKKLPETIEDGEQFGKIDVEIIKEEQLLNKIDPESIQEHLNNTIDTPNGSETIQNGSMHQNA